jgi:ABC-type Fe3+ transport system permease subunit
MVLGRLKWLATAAIGLYLGLSTLLPVLAIVYECQSPALFVENLRAAAPETENSLWIAAAAALLATTSGCIVVLGLPSPRRTPGRVSIYAWVVDLVPMALLGIPTLALGLSYAHLFHRGGPLDLSFVGDTSALVILGLAARGFPFATRIISHGQGRISGPWHEAAHLAGLGHWRKWWWIDLPLVASHAAAGAVVAFVLCLGEVEISQLLCAPGSGTLALRLFTFLHFEPHVAANLAILQLGLAVLPVLAYFVLTNRSLKVV